MKIPALLIALGFCTSGFAALRLDLELQLQKGRMLLQSAIVPENEWTRISEDDVGVDVRVSRPGAARAAHVDYRVMDLGFADQKVLGSGALKARLGSPAALEVSELDGGEIIRFSVTTWPITALK